MYLVKRRQKWWAMHDIPRYLHVTLGRTRFAESLGTSDRKEAVMRSKLLEARWLREIAAAQSKAPRTLEDEAAYWKRLLKDAGSEAERDMLREHIHDELQARALAAAEKAGFIDYREGWDKAPGVEEALKVQAIALGVLTGATEALEDYLATLNNEPKSIHMKRSTVLKFSETFPYLKDIDRKSVQSWVNSQVQAGKAVATIRRALSELRGYWTFLQAAEMVPADVDPFAKLTLPKAKRKAAAQDERQPFTAEQVVALWKEAQTRGDQQLADLIALGMWTGARREELCSMRATSALNGVLTIEDAKTRAGIRTVPIHPKLAPTVNRLIGASKDGFLLSGLTANKYGDRSDAVGKRFGRMKADLGYGEAHVFHSIRKTVATLLENAGVPEGVAADILGHDKPTMTYGLYSGGASLEVKAEALARLAYPGA